MCVRRVSFLRQLVRRAHSKSKGPTSNLLLDRYSSDSLLKSNHIPGIRIPPQEYYNGINNIKHLKIRRQSERSRKIHNPVSSRTMATHHGPTTEDAIALFKEIEGRFPHQTLGNDKWYLVAISALVGVDPDHVGSLYSYLISKPEFTTPESRQALVRRFREALVKNVSLQGVCKPLEAVMVIAKLERPIDQDFSFSREKWQSGPENRARGDSWLNTIYKGNLSTATDNFKAHKDFDFISREITYGLYLSDLSILGPIETELVVLSGIMIQNLPIETAWHLRGTRRVGVSMADVELIQQCIELVAKFGGARLHKVPRIADVEHEV